MSFNEFITPIVVGNYCVRMLKNEKELREYQDLRYKHLICGFDPEKANNTDPNVTDYNLGYDKDTSQMCVFYTNPETGEEKIVGGYIMMRFRTKDQFCKATLKYDISKLIEKYKYECLEMTRAIVHPDHRNGTAVLLLWEGVIAYMTAYNLRYAFGTMSFLGLDPLVYREAASYLYHYYLMPEDIMVHPIKGDSAYYFDIIPKEQIDKKVAIRQLPPLVKGFICKGAEVGTGFYIDYDLKVVETFSFFDITKHKRFIPFK